MSSTAPDKRVFHALDAGRGIAALVVVIFHLPASVRGSAFGSGELAVDFFFALSGFVLAHVYNDQLATGRINVRQFMVARLVRLYPLYLLSLLTLLIALVCLRVFSQPIPWSNTALLGKLPFALFMLPLPTLDPDGYLYPFNVAAWSILLEIAVNLLFAIFWKLLQSARVRWALIAVSARCWPCSWPCSRAHWAVHPGICSLQAFCACASRSSSGCRSTNDTNRGPPGLPGCTPPGAWWH